MKSLFFALGMTFALGCSGKSGKGTESADDAEQIKALIPEAAGIDNKTLKSILESVRPPSLETLHDSRLTMVILCMRGDGNPRSEEDKKEFDILTNHPVNLIKFIEKSSDKGYGTLVQPETIKEVTCRVDGDSATGIVRFEAEGVCRGEIEYSAMKTQKGWRIEEFRLPRHKIKLTRGADGRWKQ